MAGVKLNQETVKECSDNLSRGYLMVQRCIGACTSTQAKTRGAIALDQKDIWTKVNQKNNPVE